MNISPEPADQPEVVALIAELDAYQAALYPPESRHFLDLESLKRPNVLFFVARDDARKAVGCGAVVLNTEYGEIKRMYVRPGCRGKGIARRLLESLEQASMAGGCQLLLLETGPLQPEALRLYAALGYKRRGPFGDYANDPLSIFMHKRLAGGGMMKA